ncbi:MAG: DUF2339 domain-containing protein [Acidimicrobiales bacterium]
MTSSEETPNGRPAGELEREVASLRGRVERLEARLVAVERVPPPPTGAPVLPPLVHPSASGPPAPPPRPEPGQPARHRPPILTRSAFSSELLLKWSGLVLVVLAGLFLVGTAIDRGWIGPEAQLALAIALGLALIAGGFRLVATSPAWSRSLAIGGVLVLALSAIGSNVGLHLVEPGTALALMAIVVVAMLIVARRLQFESVATVASVSGIVGPLAMLADSDLPDLVVAGWVSAIIVVATLVGLVNRWPILRLLSSFVGALTLLGLALEDDGGLGPTERTIAFVLVAVVSLAIWAAPGLAAKFGARYGGWLLSLDHRSVLYVPTWSFAVIAALADFDSRRLAGGAGLLLAACYAIAALATAPIVARRLHATHLLAAGTLLSVSLAVLTTSPTLLVAISIQAVGTAYLARRFDDVFLKANAAGLSAVALVWSSLSIIGGWLEPLPWGDHLANLVVVVLLVGAAAVAWSQHLDWLGRALIVGGWVWTLGWLAAVLIHSAQGQVLVSIVWAAAAAGAIAFAVKHDDGLARALGLGTLMIVLGKLLAVDMAAVDTLWRVGLFFVVGAGLLRLGYLLPRLSTTVDPQGA